MTHDGRWIYFQSDHAGVAEVWRIPATGGSEERVTHGGGSYAFESADGKTLFFTRTLANGPLLAVPLVGGPERKVLDCVPPRAFAIGPGGVYHFGCSADPRPRAVPLYLLDPATGRDRGLIQLQAVVATNLRASASGSVRVLPVDSRPSLTPATTPIT